METKSLYNKIRYLRIPHWVRLEYRCFNPRDPFFDVHIKAHEHRIKRGSLSVRGIIFDADGYIPCSAFVAIRVNLTEESIPFEFDCRIVRSKKMEEDHQYRITAEFIARTEVEVQDISRFVSKYY